VDSKQYIRTLLLENLIESQISVNDIKKIKSFTTSEGDFAHYDYEEMPRRAAMFTIFESPDGWIIRNAFVPESLQKQGIATEFYRRMNQLSHSSTGNPLRSTQPRTLSTGEVVHELSMAGIALWDSLVSKGYAQKLSHKNYIFTK